MRKPRKIKRSKSRKSFSKAAVNVNPKNATPTPMRGGIRL